MGGMTASPSYKDVKVTAMKTKIVLLAWCAGIGLQTISYQDALEGNFMLITMTFVFQGNICQHQHQRTQPPNRVPIQLVLQSNHLATQHSHQATILLTAHRLNPLPIQRTYQVQILLTSPPSNQVSIQQIPPAQNLLEHQ